MKKDLFSAIIPGQPVPQGRPRVARSTGRVYYNKRSTAQRKLLSQVYFLSCHARSRNIDVPCSVTIGVAGMHGNGDLDNAAKLVLDSLVDAGVLLTDRASVVRELVVQVLEGEPRTEVLIRSLA